jgi:hypothetical protein
VRCVRAALLVGYAAMIVAALTSPLAPRVFWTVLMPAIPLSILLMGFHRWRRACPVAAVGELGARIAPRLHRWRLPPRVQRWGGAAALMVLAACLWIRLMGANGDGRWLATLLLTLPVAAVVVNAALSGRAFCHYVCPVGIVERIYTDGARPRLPVASQCAPCTGCRAGCPDADARRAFARDARSAHHRVAVYAFPGLVLGFYGYYFLRAGTFEAFFDGRWAREPAGHALFFGPGFFFAPHVPAFVAAALTLLVASGLSLALLVGVERWVERRTRDAHVARQRLLAVTAFGALHLFYLFAGQPTLRLAPGLARLFALGVATVAVLMLTERWKEARWKR